ncbi:MAG: hypothetical protein EZS28_011232 [Streblomastix strix]|uniref:Uncharacterized protein n=1 Tax=Streblomastix strix TaxID=222440 RepID=A0A5J4WES6_9EUKA|nr:MAG: hypothetical protein EZS28_011232 [Streblomastix strix]
MLKPRKYSARLKKNLTMKKMKNNREHYWKRQNLGDLMLNREYQAIQRTSTQAADDQKAQYGTATAEKVAQLLYAFNIWGINKQSKSSLSMQEVVYNPEEYKQSSGRRMSSLFVPLHQDVITLRNLVQTVSSKVQTTSSADGEHEAPMKKEKETDDPRTINAFACSSY